MWRNKKVGGTISERPDEEDMESETNGYNKVKNKVNIILEEHIEHKKSYSYLLRNDKQSIKKLLNNDKINTNNTYLDKVKTKNDFEILNQNPKILNSEKKAKRNNSIEFLKVDNAENEEFPEFYTNEVLEQEVSLDKNQKQFSSIKSITNSEKMRQYIRFKEAWNYFSSLSLFEEKAKCKIEDYSKLSCLRRLYIKCNKNYILDYELQDERLLVFAISKVTMNDLDEYHLRMTKTLYNSFTGQREQNEPDWIKIGFQSDNFKTDLRSVGMFSILQALSLTDRLTAYSHELFHSSHHARFGFPLMLVLINLTYLTLCSLREGYLIPFCNSRKSVINTMNEFYFGLVEYFFTIYKSTNCVYDNINYLLKEIKKVSDQNTNLIFDIAKELLIRYPHVKDSMSLEVNNSSFK